MEPSGSVDKGSSFISIGGALARDAGPLFGVRVAGAAANFVVLLLLVHRMPEEDVGLYYFLVNLWNILNVLVDFGGEPIATREIAGNPGAEGGILRDFLIAKAFLAGLGLVVFCTVVWTLIEASPYRTSFLLTILVLPGFYFGSFSVVFRVRHKMRWPALALLVGHTLFLLGSLAGLLLLKADQDRFRALALAFSTGTCTGGVLIFLMARRGLPALNRGQGAVRFLKQAFPQGVAALAGILYFYVDTLMLKAMQGDAEAGYYNAAYRLLNFFIYAAGVISISVLPVLARALKDSEHRLHAVFRETLSLLLLLAIPTCAGGLALTPELMGFLYGEKMAVYHVAVPTLRILLVAGVFTFAGALASITLVTLKRQGLWMGVALTGLGVNVGMNLWLIPKLGHVGAAWATLVTEGLVTCLCLLLVWRIRRLTPGGFWILRVSLLGAAVFAVGLGVRSFPFPVAALACFLVSLVGAGCLRVVPRRLFRMTLLGDKETGTESD